MHPTPKTSWFKSSYSQGDAGCIEVVHLPTTFRKSSYSQSEAACVEVADWATGAAIRDTKHRELGALVFPADEWQAFLGAVKRRGL